MNFRIDVIDKLSSVEYTPYTKHVYNSRFEETSVKTPTCRTNDNYCLGGFPRIYHHIQTLLKEKPNAVLLNAGDSFQGTFWYTLLKWNIIQEFMNLLPHDAHVRIIEYIHFFIFLYLYLLKIVFLIPHASLRYWWIV